MRTIAMVALATALGTQVARADEPAPETTPATPAETPAPAAAPAPAPAPTPPAVAREEAEEPASTVETSLTLDRPDAFSIGIGAGYSLPADLDRPNTVSVRFRLASGVALEPFVFAGTQSTTIDDPFAEENKSTFNQLFLGTNLRVPVRQRGPFDLLFLGSASFLTATDDPDGSDNSRSDTMVTLDWGLALDWWLTPHMTVGVSALNPILSYISTEQKQGGSDTSSRSTTSLELAFNPRVSVLFHLYL